MKMTMKRSRGGFTLIEIMLVVVIIGILMTIAVVKFSGHTQEAQINAARADIKAFGTALALYEMHNGSFPTSDQGLQALISAPANAHNWRGPYMESPRIKTDPWGTPYLYKYPGDKMPHSFDLSSAGPNKVHGDADDIGNWDL
jgi:general secretion pathway protein G